MMKPVNVAQLVALTTWDIFLLIMFIDRNHIQQIDKYKHHTFYKWDNKVKKQMFNIELIISYSLTKQWDKELMSWNVLL